MPRFARNASKYLSVGLVALLVLAGCSRSSQDANMPKEGARRTLTSAPPSLPEDLAQWPTGFATAIAKAEQERDWPRLAKLYHANGFFQRAETCYLASRNEDRRSHGFQRLVADLARQRGDFDSERAALTTALQNRPTAVATRLALAASFERAGQYGEARKHYEIVLEQEPGNGPATLGLARDDIRGGETEVARSRLQALVESSESWPSAFALLAELEAERGASAAAVALAEKAWGKKDPPIEDRPLDALVPLCFNFEILSRQFESRAASNDAEGAGRLFKRMVAVDENHWRVIRYRAFILVRQYKPEQAAAMYERALAAGAPADVVYPELVDAWRRAKRPQKALEAAQAGLQQLPGHPELLLHRARLLLSADRPAEAREAVERLVAISPDNPTVHLLRGDVLDRLEQPAAAAAAWDQARALLTLQSDPAVREALSTRP